MADVKVTTTPKNELKALIKGSTPSKPFQCGVALDPKNRALAFLLVHRSSGGRQLAAQLKSVPGVNMATFGHVMTGAHSDHPQAVKDADCAVFQLEKPLSGLSKRLKATLKGTGFKKVQIVYDGGMIESDLVVEPGSEEEEADEAQITETGETTARTTATEAPQPTKSDADPLAEQLAAAKQRLTEVLAKIEAANVDPERKKRLSAMATDADKYLAARELAQAVTRMDAIEGSLTAPPAPDAPPPPEVKPQDLGALEQRLNGLVDKMKAAKIGGDRENQFRAIENDARKSLTAKDGAAALGFINTYEADLRLATAAPTTGQREAAPNVSFAKSRLIWIAARQKMQSDLDKLHAKIVDTYKTDSELGEIENRFKETIQPMLDQLNEELVDRLDDVTNAADAAKRTEFIKVARLKIEEYQAYVNQAELIGHLDKNPFVPLAIRETLVKTLDALHLAVH